jgi:pimeloyl-ACP methyl ester carboxylesterase
MNFIRSSYYRAFVLATLLCLSCNNSETKKTLTMENDTAIQDSANQATINKNMVRGSAGDLYVDDGGQGGIPVIFLHSFAGSSQHWAKQLEHIRRSRRALAIDLRGHGRSAPAADYDYSVESMMNDISAVVDSLKINRFVLVGHSMGGSAAIDYAAKHPKRVAGLLVTGTPGKTPEEQSKPIITSLESEKYDTVMKEYMNRLLKDATPATEQITRSGISGISKEASLSMIKALFMYDPLPALRNYPGPVWIVNAKAEEQPNSLHQSFPKFHYKVINGTSHWVHLDKPGDFNRILDEFLNEVK